MHLFQLTLGLRKCVHIRCGRHRSSGNAIVRKRIGLRAMVHRAALGAPGFENEVLLEGRYNVTRYSWIYYKCLYNNNPLETLTDKLRLPFLIS